MTQLRRVAIVGGNRIPFARSNTVYATASNQEMLTSALKAWWSATTCTESALARWWPAPC